MTTSRMAELLCAAAIATAADPVDVAVAGVNAVQKETARRGACRVVPAFAARSDELDLQHGALAHPLRRANLDVVTLGAAHQTPSDRRRNADLLVFEAGFVVAARHRCLRS